MSASARIRLGAAALAAGVLFLLYPAVRPWPTSPRWTAPSAR